MIAEKVLSQETLDFPPEDFYYRNTYNIVSTVSYLIGVPQHIFENDHMSQDETIFRGLDQKKSARIIRHLCILRTAIERNFGYIKEKMNYEYKTLLSLPEYIPAESINQLSRDGINVMRSHTKTVDYIIDINRLITDRINNCKEFFPSWINWQYLRSIFIMPDGLTEAGTKIAASQYYSMKAYYPFQVYINWPASDQGNILYNDKKFVTLLYEWNHDTFTDLSKVSDASIHTKGNIYDFLDDSTRTVVVVDCENSDPYKLCCVLRNLEEETLNKIARLILFDDVHTSSAWELLDQYIDIPIERILIERIKQNKSLVDIRMTADSCKEFYQNHTDSFIIVSSDSDYWGLISALPEAHFLVMIEREKCGPDLKNALSSSGIFYCFIDDFYSGDDDEMKTSALMREVRKELNQEVSFNINGLMEQVYRTTRVSMTEDEKKKFYEKHLKSMHLDIDETGEVRIALNSWK